jgi:hypothetical protein
MEQQVEEGVCQLIAHLWLAKIEKDGDEDENNGSASGSAREASGGEGGPTNEDLRKYFIYSIEADTSEVYGDGFRKAAELYAMMGLEPLLNFVMEEGKWPR